MLEIFFVHVLEWCVTLLDRYVFIQFLLYSYTAQAFETWFHVTNSVELPLLKWPLLKYFTATITKKIKSDAWNPNCLLISTFSANIYIFQAQGKYAFFLRGLKLQDTIL